MLGLPIQALKDAFQQTFKKKPELAVMNAAVAEKAYEFTLKNVRSRSPLKPPAADGKKRILLKGTDAVGIGKIKAGCGFQSYYPISPATDESVFLESRIRQWPMLVVQ